MTLRSSSLDELIRRGAPRGGVALVRRQKDESRLEHFTLRCWEGCSAAEGGWGRARGRQCGPQQCVDVGRDRPVLERIMEGQQREIRLLEVRVGGEARGSGVMEIQE